MVPVTGSFAIVSSCEATLHLQVQSEETRAPSLDEILRRCVVHPSRIPLTKAAALTAVINVQRATALRPLGWRGVWSEDAWRRLTGTLSKPRAAAKDTKDMDATRLWGQVVELEEMMHSTEEAYHAEVAENTSLRRRVRELEEEVRNLRMRSSE